MDRVFLWILRVLGAFCFAALLIVQMGSPRLKRLSCWGSDAYGDLYQLAKVRVFKIPLPAEAGPPKAPFPRPNGRRRLVLLGDSFSEHQRGHEPFARLLARQARVPLVLVRWPRGDRGNPACLFKTLDALGSGRGKTWVVMETTERSILARFLVDFSTRCAEPSSWPSEGAAPEKRKGFFPGRDARESEYRYLLMNSVLTSPLVEAWNSLRFQWFGVISRETPAYCVNPPMLFYRAEVEPRVQTSFYYPHPRRTIDAVAGHVQQVARILKSRYEAGLIVLPVPNKYTIYHALIRPGPYDRFLPRLCEALEARDIPCVRLYERFRKEPRPLYFPGDTHWNGRGVAIAVEETVRALRLGRPLRSPKARSRGA